LEAARFGLALSFASVLTIVILCGPTSCAKQRTHSDDKLTALDEFLHYPSRLRPER
jgi:hypothetical protein